MAFDTADFDYEKPLGTFSADGENAKAIDCLGGSGVSLISFMFYIFNLNIIFDYELNIVECSDPCIEPQQNVY